MSEEITSLKQRLNELEELNRLAQTLGSTLNVDEILTAIIDASLKLCRAERAAILLFSPSSKEIVKTLVRSSDPSYGNIHHRLNVFVAGWIEHHKKPFIAEDIVKELPTKNLSERLRILGPTLAVPLVVGGETLGIINLVNSHGGTTFSEEAVRVATLIAALAAQFIQRARLHETLFEDNLRLKSALQQHYGMRSMLGQSPLMQEIFEKISIAAASTATVLVTGETGTGKELVARAIHFQSMRADKPFVAINCAAIPAALFESELFGHERGAFTGATETHKGKFELAHHGTLFLDEISDMPLDLQPKLLRVLEEQRFYRVGSSTELQVDARVIAASSKDLSTAVQGGKFRAELFYRLNVVPMYLPPLRERSEDIPILARTFLDEFSANAKCFTADALKLLGTLEWRGNVRELRNAVERVSIFINAKEISSVHLRNLGITSCGLSQLPLTGRDLTSAFEELLSADEKSTSLLEVVEKNLTEFAMMKAKGNVSQAAQLLGISWNALQRRIKKYGL